MGAALSGLLSACGLHHDSAPSRANTVHLDSEITFWSGGNVVADIRRAGESPSHIPLEISINSIGGSVPAAMRIVDEIENSSRTVQLNCEGAAQSMAAIILITATGENRNATSDCRIMIHQAYYTIERPLADTRTDYHSLREAYELALQEPEARHFSITQPGDDPYTLSRSRLMRWYERLSEDREIFAERLAATSRFTEDDVTKMFDQGDVYFDTPYEAAFAGLIDTIEGGTPDPAKVRAAGREWCKTVEDISICGP